MMVRILIAGLAVFAMFFGTGNLVFPLALGVESLAAWPWAFAGFVLSDVALTLAGMLAMLLLGGDIGRFFRLTGRLGQRLVPWLLLLLLGPLVVMPRAVGIAHGSLLASGVALPIAVFSPLFLAIAWLANRHPGRLVEVIGRYFTPLKIVLLTTVIGACYLAARHLPLLAAASPRAATAFGHGFTAGYETMDLIGVVFFGAVIMRYFASIEDPARRLRGAFAATTLGMALLLLCYLALFHLGAHYAAELRHLPATEMLPRIAKIALGELSEELTAATIIVASLTLTIVLSSVFAEYCVAHVKALRGRYREVLIATLVLDCAMSMLEFERIVHYSDQLLGYLYPPLILLTMVNLVLALRKGRASRPETS